jgi:predicted HicB family RNase H-like nuclease
MQFASTTFRMTKSKKMGRPKLPKNEAKTVFCLRLSPLDQRQIEAAAKRDAKPVRQWARDTLILASMRQ